MGKPAASRADAVFPSTSGPRLWSALTRRRVVLLAGSAPEAAALADVDLDGLVRVAINNAWRIRSDFDYVVFPRNFPDENRPPQDYPADLVREVNYLKHVRSAGGLLFSGSTMAFNAGYWAVRYLTPAMVGFYACDMIYDDKETHFYGKGEADPLRGNLTLRSLEAKSARLFAYGLAAGTMVVNFSTRPRSRLVFPRLPLAAIRQRSPVRRLCSEAVRSMEARRIVATAREIASMEASPPFAADPNDYWSLVGDETAIAYLDDVDRRWLAIVPEIAALGAAIERGVSGMG
ncbi:MAG: hypothetical protein KDJ86_09175 [Bauldia sp.]|uniref:hypothetical protein n=1 Tax=Bauldia sp. TaxID=2575872 RepID=UPI001D740A81|nr:hypothetical protein [Bauldia sp.]MCB1495943.1 hypothetical protein [Bauldia sp.]